MLYPINIYKFSLNNIKNYPQYYSLINYGVNNDELIINTENLFNKIHTDINSIERYIENNVPLFINKTSDSFTFSFNLKLNNYTTYSEHDYNWKYLMSMIRDNNTSPLYFLIRKVNPNIISSNKDKFEYFTTQIRNIVNTNGDIALFS